MKKTEEKNKTIKINEIERGKNKKPNSSRIYESYFFM